MATALVKLEAIRKGLETGSIVFDQARGLFRETWQTAFPTYDMEKVFWRSVYGVGIFGLLWFAWTVGAAWRSLLKALMPAKPKARTPEGELIDIPNEVWKEVWDECQAEGVEGGNLFLACVTVKLRERGYERLERAEEEEEEKAPFLVDLGDKIFLENPGLAALLIPVLFAALEWKEMKRRNEMLASLMI